MQTVLVHGRVELAWTTLLYCASPLVFVTTDGGIGTRCSDGWHWSTTAYPHTDTSVGGRWDWELFCPAELDARSVMELRSIEPTEVPATTTFGPDVNDPPAWLTKKNGWAGADCTGNAAIWGKGAWPTNIGPDGATLGIGRCTNPWLPMEAKSITGANCCCCCWGKASGCCCTNIGCGENGCCCIIG